MGLALTPSGFLGGVSSQGPSDNLPWLLLGNNAKAKPKVSWLILCCDALVQWFSIFLMLRPFNTVPYLVVTPSYKGSQPTG